MVNEDNYSRSLELVAQCLVAGIVKTSCDIVIEQTELLKPAQSESVEVLECDSRASEESQLKAVTASRELRDAETQTEAPEPAQYVTVKTRKSVFRRLKIFQKKPKKDDDGNSGAQNKSKRSIFTRMFCWK